ncbi:hypothetical protein LAD12857_00290 [Lacrimispora amygdalina]|uniref:Uncharacterized protein n=1 Tax=Lacrimispora amygdalina TaxID=253257 RepID=A0A3E2NIF4_9FIRM|nr:hypothetical protein [Clostridium indicum]RFZ80701.1 hypothetical protein DS742_01635 [Clostridium indicum]
MRIGNDQSIAQSRPLSGTGKRGNVPSPDYNDFHFNTKTAPAMSDDKYHTAIIEQAKKDQAAGKFQSESAGFRNLVKSYVSAVSPDRKSIISEGLRAVYKNIRKEPKTFNLLDYMFGSVKYSKEANDDVSYAEFYDSNGEMVASYSNGRWISYGTKAENARETELWGIYNHAWNSAAKASRENQGAANGSAAASIDVTG